VRDKGDRMKKTTLLLIIGIMLVFSNFLFATPPDSIKVSFDTTGTIMITHIFHATKNPSVHFINQVSVTLQGKPIIQQTIAKQFSNTEQDVIYQIIDIKKGDNIAVTGSCNIMGKKTKEIIAPGPKIK